MTEDRTDAPPAGEPGTPAVPDLPNEAVLVGLESLAVHVATEAGRLVVEQRPGNLSVAETKSTITDIVTEMDQRSQDLLIARLGAARPDDGFYGEERGGSDGSSGLTWVVDPIDGTVNYLYDIPAYAVSVAAVIGDPRVPGGWRPVAGAVVNPVSGEVFRAHAGGGAWRSRGRLGPEQVRVGRTDRADLALIGTGFGYAVARRRWQAEVLARVLTEVRDIRRIGSAALDLCHVADGTLDGYYERGLNPWDMAAGWLVLTEAGGQVSGLASDHPSGEMVLAAGPDLHEALRSVVGRAVAAVEPEPEDP